MLLSPVFCNIAALADPDLVVAQHVIDDLVQRRDMCRAAQQSCVEAYSQHFGVGFALFVKVIERIIDIGDEFSAGLVTLSARKAAVICI